jgi:hypothetical protein
MSGTRTQEDPGLSVALESSQKSTEKVPSKVQRYTDQANAYQAALTKALKEYQCNRWLKHKRGSLSNS